MNVPSFDEFIESIFIDQMAEVVSEVDSQEVPVPSELRLARLEEELLGRLERLGSLSLAEESRLNDIRHQRSALKAH
eukprot:g3962.t1